MCMNIKLDKQVFFQVDLNAKDNNGEDVILRLSRNKFIRILELCMRTSKNLKAVVMVIQNKKYTVDLSGFRL